MAANGDLLPADGKSRWVTPGNGRQMLAKQHLQRSKNRGFTVRYMHLFIGTFCDLTACVGAYFSSRIRTSHCGPTRGTLRRAVWRPMER